MSSEYSIKVAGLGKCYQIYDLPRDRLKQFVMPRIQRLARQMPKQYFHEFWALKDVSFEVNRGETVGIIGRNGSGKSTLLHMICGTLAPSCGSIETKGRIAALLELGSGFDPEFTGRENVYFNGAVLGLSKEEIDARFNDIAAFADIGEFIEQPVKNYSSGMIVRLAFAVQAQSDPDILIVDEALAVGDAKFQAKCFAHLKNLKQRGTSILLVSHASEQIVTHCDRAIFLKDGQAVVAGKPRDVINIYLNDMFGTEKIDEDLETLVTVESPPAHGHALSLSEDVFNTHKSYNPHEYRWGDGAAQIIDYCLIADENIDPSTINKGASVKLQLSIGFRAEVIHPILGFTIKTKEGVTLYNTNSELQAFQEINSSGTAGDVLGLSISFKAQFSPGEYFISIGVASRHPDGNIVPHDRRYDSIQMTVISNERSTFSGFFDIGAEMRFDFHETKRNTEQRTGITDAA